MPKQKSQVAQRKPRALPVVVDEWWRLEVLEVLSGKRDPRLGKAEMSQVELVAELVEKKHKINKWQLNRTLTSNPDKRRPLLHVVEAVSDHFGIPRPVIVAESELEAYALDNARQRFALRKAQTDGVDASIAAAAADTERVAETRTQKSSVPERVRRKRPGSSVPQ